MIIMEEYIKVNVYKYVKDGLEKGTMVPFQAEKYTRIIARPGVFGEEIISWSVNEKGEPIKERVNRVKIDPETGNPGWVVTKISSDGIVLIDANGHDNSWIIGDKKFREKYEIDNPELGIFKPVGSVQTFVKIDKDIILSQWESEMKIARGGYINITNPEDMYGISERDFLDTYRVVLNDTKKNQKTLV